MQIALTLYCLENEKEEKGLHMFITNAMFSQVGKTQIWRADCPATSSYN